MKRIAKLAAVLLMTLNIWAQAPQSMSYQALIRTTSNATLSNASVGMQISILHNSINGTPIFTETQTPTTDANGLISIDIGTGSAIIGNFSTIDWTDGPYFIQTAIDFSGGTNYTETSKTQLLSAPYALYAETSGSAILGPQGVAGNIGAPGPQGLTGPIGPQGPQGVVGNTISGPQGLIGLPGQQGPQGIAGIDGAVGAQGPAGITGPQGPQGLNGVDGATGPQGSFGSFTHYLGEDFDGGIIFHLYKGSDGLEHGLIVSKTEGYGIFQAVGTFANATSRWDGYTNSQLITNSPTINFATSMGPGWYVPSNDEFKLLFSNRYHANKGLNNGGYTLLTAVAFYWTSTEDSAAASYYFYFLNGHQSIINKHNNYLLYRAIKAF